ncbi:ATP-binding protein [Burkholderia gladioli pv. gladioli]|uniref:histidine kinase n=1 Tax=Burkholderia gladioli TaxID=28095 RepID=A0AAW3F5B6_BURGA|nr:ATP-binding protein [Burkholderia gladioli]AJW95830.1 HAMP domain protein [Burkholderia gladioli]ASD83687.1 two-component sensor histidine kinase [Burkholderia gladioli pv. gladioli]KGC15005.1 HAMP domain protein [Burkholderia gladioli]MBU9177304.1 HAMP domain-containing protein [Burkholderia gladioli]MDJ1166707.1 ATP-binding protein [Burkholderia gladioli pv. gladioli]
MRMPWPRSLLGRHLLLLSAVVLASMLSTFAVFFAFIQNPRIDEAAALVASQTRMVAQLLTALPPEARRRELLAINGDEPAMPPPDSVDRTHGYMPTRFLRHLRRNLPPDTQIRWQRGTGRFIWVRMRIDGQPEWVVIPLSTGLGLSLPLGLIAELLALAVFPALGAWFMQRHMAGRLSRLARAAKAVERGAWPAPVPVDGPRELATVAETFNRMVASLAELDATRAELLAGVSHDIRTPLTKLRMAIAAPEAFEAPSASAERFVAEIDAIVEQFIDYARGWDSEAAVPGDLNALAGQLAADYVGLGYGFALSLAPLPPHAYRPTGMQRLLMNLMHNAVIHGKLGLAVRSWAEPGAVLISVQDGGPGVPADQLPLLKRPFRRGDDPDRPPGSGLGLAIAERIARQHGGRLDLSLREGGGLAATLRLPAARD